VPIEPKISPYPNESLPVSPIENEIPTYRAISPQAVFSLICGVLAVLSFAHWIFLISAALAIVLGILADRKIVRMSDVLTGREIAQAGIALGLIFGLASITTMAVQGWIQVREATKFAKTYRDVLGNGTLEEILWYGQNPVVRKGKSPKELVAEMQKAMRGPGMFELENATVTKLKSHLADEGAKLRFVKIEKYGRDKLDYYASALFELEQPTSMGHPEGEEFVLVVLKGWNSNRKFDWWVESLAFPYQPDSYKPTPKPVDDGHGHAH
jgi:hypothetical protein